ncbi:hypothetical protein L873DRAFT_1785702 [Choiromyces venosus 120613-1]|uniref:Uncharacterized protein n=1 Tax=Choiromyces venosus 120613-1 TaxID=1336337 RepID=A0A3N4K847_9PEZI|nr:hypothetical protein L873DRAFT_1785702 [Choiromyces venosus 120613-1]
MITVPAVGEILAKRILASGHVDWAENIIVMRPEITTTLTTLEWPCNFGFKAKFDRVDERARDTIFVRYLRFEVALNSSSGKVKMDEANDLSQNLIPYYLTNAQKPGETRLVRMALGLLAQKIDLGYTEFGSDCKSDCQKWLFGQISYISLFETDTTSASGVLLDGCPQSGPGLHQPVLNLSKFIGNPDFLDIPYLKTISYYIHAISNTEFA